MNDSAWYLIKAKTRSEHTARESLLEGGYTCYLPLARKDKRTGGEGMEVLFPGYICVFLTIGVDDFYKIKKTKGCLYIVPGAGSYARFPPGAVEGLMLDADLRDVAMSYKPGDRIYMQGGVLGHNRGKIESLPGGDRVKLLLDFMVQSIEVNTSDIRPELG